MRSIATVNVRRSAAKRVMPFGDSITRGVGSTDELGYRSQLFSIAANAGKRIEWVGSAAYPATAASTTVSGRQMSTLHEGRPGWSIIDGNPGTQGIASLLPAPALDIAPDIILLNVGVNDLNHLAEWGTTIEQRLDQLLTRIATYAPKVFTIVAKPTPYFSSSVPQWDAYQAAVPGVVQSHIALGQRFGLVDMSVLLQTDTIDGVHPNDGGYLKMAQIWWAALKDKL